MAALKPEGEKRDPTEERHNGWRGSAARVQVEVGGGGGGGGKRMDALAGEHGSHIEAKEGDAREDELEEPIEL